MDHLFDIAKKKAKLEHFTLQKQETTKIRLLKSNHDETFNQFEAFATKLIEVDRSRHRHLLSTEIDEFAQQKEIDDDANNRNAMYRTEWKDSELKDTMKMTTEYLYHDYHDILFTDDKDNASWKYKYPQWVSEQANDDTYLQQHMIHIDAPYTQDKDHIKMHTKDTNEKRKEFALEFNKLDPIQQHFLQRANHSELTSFVHALDRKQHIFLAWLVYCYYHQVKCRGRKHLPNT
eukprot:46020_1